MFIKPNSKYAWFQIDFSKLSSIPIFKKISITQEKQKVNTLPVCCNVPDIFVEFSNDTKNWMTFQSPIGDGQTVINFATLQPISINANGLFH